MDEVRTARPADLLSLPALEAAADTLFDTLDFGPLPGPGTVEQLAAAKVVLVAGEPPRGFARIELIDGVPHLEQLSVHPDFVGQGLGRALLRAAVDWAASAGHHEMTLATYREVPWNGPFYASEGFVEVGSVNDWYAEHGLPPEEPEMRQYGTRVLMRRRW